ncbi:MAG TPA: hypothetical protein VGV92_08215 [Gammaproteobacteria bacterium]|nr:hypothetical protein [Gammaproteobacteria bacterium]
MLDDEDKRIIKDVIGTEDIETLLPLIENKIKHYFNDALDKVIFIHASIGVTLGLQLESGKKIILKIHSPLISQSYLTTMNNIIDILSHENYPAPKVLSPIFDIHHAYSGFYEYIDGTLEDAHKPIIREALAKYKAYENYRNKKFTGSEYKIISASADYLIAIIARFEHAGKNSCTGPYQDLLKLCEDTSFLFVA